MKVITVAGYEWCLCPKMLGSETDYQFIRTLSGRLMVYCRVERFQDDGGKNNDPSCWSAGIRKVPVNIKDISSIE